MPDSDIRIVGVGRDAENEKAIMLYCNRKPTDDELRTLHDMMREVGRVLDGNKLSETMQ